jgi:hypothetical protein
MTDNAKPLRKIEAIKRNEIERRGWEAVYLDLEDKMYEYYDSAESWAKTARSLKKERDDLATEFGAFKEEHDRQVDGLIRKNYDLAGELQNLKNRVHEAGRTLFP